MWNIYEKLWLWSQYLLNCQALAVISSSAYIIWFVLDLDEGLFAMEWDWTLLTLLAAIHVCQAHMLLFVTRSLIMTHLDQTGFGSCITASVFFFLSHPNWGKLQYLEQWKDSIAVNIVFFERGWWGTENGIEPCCTKRLIKTKQVTSLKCEDTSREKWRLSKSSCLLDGWQLAALCTLVATVNKRENRDIQLFYLFIFYLWSPKLTFDKKVHVSHPYAEEKALLVHSRVHLWSIARITASSFREDNLFSSTATLIDDLFIFVRLRSVNESDRLWYSLYHILVYRTLLHKTSFFPPFNQCKQWQPLISIYLSHLLPNTKNSSLCDWHLPLYPSQDYIFGRDQNLFLFIYFLSSCYANLPHMYTEQTAGGCRMHRGSYFIL